MSGSGFLSHSRSELSHGDEADTIGLDQHFLGGEKKNQRSTCGGVFNFIV